MAGRVPLQVKALPAGFEEGIETGVVVLLGRLDFLRQQIHRLARMTPVLLQRRQVIPMRQPPDTDAKARATTSA
jgi:hypothetical protein